MKNLLSLKGFLFCLVILTVAGRPVIGAAEESEKSSPHLFVTWEGLEPDKCASIWLVKRFVDPKAEFQFIKKGELVSKGTPFDIPEAELRRYHDRSAFESILRKYELRDPALLELGKILHDIEINFWADTRSADSEQVNSEVLQVIQSAKDDAGGVEKCNQYFDDLYLRLKNKTGRPGNPHGNESSGGSSNKNFAHALMTAHEDEANSRDEESSALPEIVVTATRGKRDPLYVPRGINVVRRERIGERSPLSVVDTLDDTIGVWVEKRTTTTSDPVIRGLSGSNLLALIDMNTLSTFWGEGGFAGDDMYGKIDADSIERVEVIRGPASVLYGSNALGGVLNFITKSCPIPYTDQGLRLGSFSKVTYGSAANEWHLRQEGYSSTPYMKALLGISYRDVDDVRTPDGIQSPTSGEDLNWDAKLEFKLAENHYLTLTTQMINRDEIHRYYRPTQDNFNDRLGAGLFYDGYSLGCWMADAIHARAYFQDKEDERIWYDSDHEEVTQVGLADTETFQTSVQLEKALGRHSITYGVDYHVDWGESPDDEQFTVTTLDDGIKRKASPDTDWQGLGTFIQDEWRVFDRLDLIGAVRFDYFIFRSHVGEFYVPAGGDDPEIDEFTDHEQSVTGGFGLVFHLMERFNLFANYQRGFRQFAPNFGIREHGFGILTPNQLLDPVTSDNWEVGVKVDRRGWGGEALYYYSDFNNFQNIVRGTFQGSDWYDYNENGERDDGEDVYVTVGNGDAYVYGVEASSWLELSTLWEAIPRGLTLHAGFMWNYGRDRTNDIPLRHTHPMRGILKLRYDEPTERRWWFEVMADMVDRFDRIPPDRLANDVGYLEEPQDPSSGMRRAYGLPGYTAYHLRAGYRFSDHVQASLSLDNLTDKLYRRAHSRWDEPGTNALVSLELTF